MYGINFLLFSHLNNSFYIQVSSDRLFALTNLIRFISFKSMKRKAVFVGIYCYSSNTKFMRCPADPYRYLTTVGNEKLFKFPDFHKKPLHIIYRKIHRILKISCENNLFKIDILYTINYCMQ
ncbi:hypothetical protein KSU1_C0819 [Candidatus Jettenia caeni]|uniref:Uncharacterized protein n=1 Tax=Candidatus Jettenia caeni TaxID=247490 RepID=I3IL20_9BACT|nr:hypothetical protein KSU1_C0819 [Candidatus Jettenia caeni]